MLSDKQKLLILKHLLELLELPDYAYEKAKDRYQDLGEFLSRSQSSLSDCAPHVFPQGSFRLGTAIRPLNQLEEYDLDLACKLKEIVSTSTHTQQQLKSLVGKEVNSYRDAREIKTPTREKHRCWRLEYKDKLSFHIDIVPCIPANENIQKAFAKRMIEKNSGESLANMTSLASVSITDDRHPMYDQLCTDWPASNPEGYALWFETRMSLNVKDLDIEKRAQIDKLPVWRKKTPLQSCIQLLKRHRDQMFRHNPDVKPISVIITTLAGLSYSGESTLLETIAVVLDGLTQFALSGSNVVSNPVNPDENFADRWTMPEHKDLKLRENFTAWAVQVRADFENILATSDMKRVSQISQRGFALSLSDSNLRELLGLKQAPSVHVNKTQEIQPGSSKPWRDNRKKK